MKYINAYIKASMLVVLTCMGLASCKKDGDAVAIVQTAAFNTINANNYAINVYQNGTRLNNLGSIGTGSQSGYFEVKAGVQQYQFKKASPDSPEYLMDFSLDLTADKVYSLFVAGDTIVVEDNPLNSSQTQATIRFVNTLPGADNLDVEIGPLSYTNVAFKTDKPYTYINPGNHNLKIYRTGSSTPVIDQTISLTAGTTYTLFTTGTLIGTGLDKLTARMILN